MLIGGLKAPSCHVMAPLMQSYIVGMSQGPVQSTWQRDAIAPSELSRGGELWVLSAMWSAQGVRAA